MRRVLVDTNVILDLLARRAPFHKESEQIFTQADLGEVELVVSSLSLVNSHYILSSILKAKDARTILRKFKVLVETHELNDKIIELSLNDDQFKDFEDGIQNYTAVESQCDVIVTRNIKDFKKASIPVMTPKEYLSAQISER